MKKWSTKEPKFWKVMKLCAVQSLLSMVLFSVSVAHDGTAQVLDKKISIDVREATIESVLEKIEQETDVKFVYNPNYFNLQEKVTITANEVTLKDVLKELFESRHIEYQFYEKENAITLRKGKKETGDIGNGGIPAFQPATITGRVTGGSPPDALAGVNVLIKGTTVGTTTDADGRYSIQTEDNAVLIFSFIGFQSYETQVNGRTVIDVALAEDSKKLDEVVVAGYWLVDSKEQTGNISQVTAKQIASQPVVNPLQALQGRVPGVQISQITGVPGDGFSIQIRGLNSIRGSGANDPLYIVDGVPFSSTTLFGSGGAIVRSASPLSSINPADIQSVEILKDADATAVYGTRGANGVVLITTKKAVQGRTKFDVNVYTGIGTMSRQLDLLNTSQYVAMRKEAFKNDGVTPTLANAPDLLLWDTTRYTNWKKELLGGTARLTSAQASISWGNSSTQFLFSGGYMKQTTVFPGDFNYQKGSTHFNIGHTSANSKFTFGFSTSFVADRNFMPGSDLTALTIDLPPDTPEIYTPTGALNFANSTFSNPYATLRKSYTNVSRNLISNLNLAYAILPGLRVKVSGGINYLSTDEKSLNPIAAQNPANNPTGSNNNSHGSITTWIAEPQVDYQRAFGEGKLTALAGMTFQQSVRDKTGFFAAGYINDTQLDNMAAAASLTPTVTYSEYKYNAIFGRLNYTWRERFIVNLTGRRDGSSRFGPDNRFANFGAVGAAWIFSKEGFIKNLLPGMSFGKLRASYGLTGSDQVGDYQYLDTYSSTTNSYQGGKGLIPTRLANPNYGWEENKKLELGLELGFIDDRVFLSASYYRNRSSNQLVGYSLPVITGFPSIQNNLPAEIQNTGVEFVLNTVNIRKGSFTWTTNFNMTFPENVLLSYPNILGSSYANTYTVGRSLYVVKKFKSLGVNQQTGLYAFEDTDNNGTLSAPADTQFIKETNTSYFGGIQNSFQFGKFEFQFLFQFVKQNGTNYLINLISAPGARSNQPTYVLSRWRSPGDIADIQRFTQTGPGTTVYLSTSQNGDNVVSDASFVRLQNVSLSYTLPLNISNKVAAEKIRFYAQGQNLLLITDFRGADPESQNARTLAPLRLVTLGAQLTF